MNTCFTSFTKRRSSFKRWAAVFITLLLLCIPFLPKMGKDGGRYELNASADAYKDARSATMSIEKYDAEFTVKTDRKIEIRQSVTVHFLKNQRMFYLALPLEGDRYYGFDVTCAGNDDFSWYVADNPIMDGFLDVNCEGGVTAGATWTYDFSYVLEIGKDDLKNGVRLDVVGFGTTVPIHNVTVTLHLPDAPISAEYISAEYGGSGHGSVTERWLDERTWVLTSDRLELGSNDYYDEASVQGITVSLIFEKGVLKDFMLTKIFTSDMWAILLFSGVLLGGGICALVFLRKKREIITVVNIKPPEGMDPLCMGKWLDGTVDSEDVTSMIYYFAQQGYLTVNLEDQDDPLLIKRVVELPETAPVYQKTLFNGLFKKGDAVRASDLSEKFYVHVDMAKKQLPSPTMYDKKSLLGFVLCCLAGVAFAVLAPLVTALCKIGGGYTEWSGLMILFPVLFTAILGLVRENYRYKWKNRKRIGILIGIIAVAVLCSFLYVFAVGSHVMLVSEKVVIAVTAVVLTFMGLRCVSRSEKYLEKLGQILGFKDFIVVTEEEKIKVMLEENPELYYDVLPYAQVLGVTNEWEGKFKRILIEAPSWCVGSQMTVFDYMILNSCLRRASIRMTARPQRKSGGFVSGSGGGGSFGGFGGGGHGGGGFGTR